MALKCEFSDTTPTQAISMNIMEYITEITSETWTLALQPSFMYFNGQGKLIFEVPCSSSQAIWGHQKQLRQKVIYIDYQQRVQAEIT